MLLKADRHDAAGMDELQRGNKKAARRLLLVEQIPGKGFTS
jgi:hypothetical protein